MLYANHLLDSTFLQEKIGPLKAYLSRSMNFLKTYCIFAYLYQSMYYSYVFFLLEWNYTVGSPFLVFVQKCAKKTQNKTKS